MEERGAVKYKVLMPGIQWEWLLKSNLIEIQRIETATYSNKAYFPGEHCLYFWEIK